MTKEYILARNAYDNYLKFGRLQFLNKHDQEHITNLIDYIQTLEIKIDEYDRLVSIQCL